jgi:chemotaxis protein CheD
MVMRKAAECTQPIGSEPIRRHWDFAHGAHLVKIFPGQYYVSQTDEILVTTLGSCISACIRDSRTGIGGMNHFMLPWKSQDREGESLNSPWNTAARYGNLAMELLINAIIKTGGNRQNLEVKLFGGAKILASMRDIGSLNVDFIKNYVQMEGLNVLAEDLGGSRPRKILYYPATGRVRMKQIAALANAAIARSERHYRSDIKRKECCGEVELFDQSEME